MRSTALAAPVIASLAGALLVLLISSATSMARSDAPRALPLFTISKSENKNQVQFAINVDERCAPIGEAPVFAYWRMLEKGPDATEPLLSRELPAYGIAAQSVSARMDGGGVERLTLRALPRQVIEVHTYRSEAGCAARAETAIRGDDAFLYNVHAMLAWPFGVDRIYLSGYAASDGRLLRETVRPQ